MGNKIDLIHDLSFLNSTLPYQRFIVITRVFINMFIFGFASKMTDVPTRVIVALLVVTWPRSLQHLPRRNGPFRAT